MWEECVLTRGRAAEWFLVAAGPLVCNSTRWSAVCARLLKMRATAVLAAVVVVALAAGPVLASLAGISQVPTMVPRKRALRQLPPGMVRVHLVASWLRGVLGGGHGQVSIHFV